MTRSKWARLVLVMAVTDDARLKLETAERQQAKIGNGTAGKLACAEAAEIISSHHSAVAVTFRSVPQNPQTCDVSL